ncbi:MAG: orotidine-5'-phosphate decarboxylase [Deltaproteobacteria bacterium]
MKPFERIVFPLDLPTEKEALEFVKNLSGLVGVFKVGLELFVASGPSVIEKIKRISPETKIFLDLKFHDIPETMKRAVSSAACLGVDFITIHVSAGEEALKAAVATGSASGGGKLKILGVTVLTSMSKQDLEDMDPALRNVESLVLRRAALAKECGLDGIVCSGLEAKKIKETFGDGFIALTPGIRLTQDQKKDDQKRVTTPYDAIFNGADYLVIGRPIRDSKNPSETLDIITKEIEKALKDRESSFK